MSQEENISASVENSEQLAETAAMPDPEQLVETERSAESTIERPNGRAIVQPANPVEDASVLPLMLQQQPANIPEPPLAYSQPAPSTPYQSSQEAARPYQVQSAPQSAQQPVQPQPVYAQAAYQQLQMPQQQFQQPGQPQEKKPANGKAIAALVLGILAILNSGTVVLGIILGVLAIIFGVLAKKQGKSGMATGGFVCGIVGTALSFIMIIVLAFAVGSLSQSDDPDQQIEDFLDGLGIGSSITATVPGYVVADDAVCTIKLTKTEIDDEGNLNIYFDFTGHTVTDLTLHTSSDKPWTVNGVKVDCIAYSWTSQNETKKGECLTIPAEYMPTDNLNSVLSVKGVVTVTLDNIHDDMYYAVVL